MENTNSNYSCKNCVFFVQHYVKVDGEYCKAYCGHCICLEDKTRKDFFVKQKDACKNFKQLIATKK